MPQGRCAGCGKTSGSTRQMDMHVMECPRYLELYAQDPRKALDPRAEFDRWQREDNSAAQRAVAKDDRLTKRFAELDQRREQQSVRWAKPKDLLADD